MSGPLYRCGSDVAQRNSSNVWRMESLRIQYKSISTVYLHCWLCFWWQVASTIHYDCVKEEDYYRLTLAVQVKACVVVYTICHPIGWCRWVGKILWNPLLTRDPYWQWWVVCVWTCLRIQTEDFSNRDPGKMTYRGQSSVCFVYKTNGNVAKKN